MKRAVSSLAAAALAAALIPASASAAEVQVGVTTSPVIAPTCPADAQGAACSIVLTQVTAYETLRDGVAAPDIIKRSGVVSAFTLGLTGTNVITAKDLTYLDTKYGGPPEAQLTVLRPTGTPAKPFFRVAAESPVILLRKQLGKVAEFPLATPLPVVKGEVLALTVPTWAPVLSFELDKSKFSYAQSRAKSTTSTGTSSCEAVGGPNLAQVVVGQLSSYSCTYPGTRIEYSALEITTPSGFSSSLRRHRTAERRAAARRHAAARRRAATRR